MKLKNKDWWKDSIVYQIYPKSFYDSNNDGVGDIVGITRKLDYLASLGIDVIWICPIYKSPMIDGGYDISDYYQIDDYFGTNEELEVLIDEASKRGIKIIMDLVINHTSDQHHWFQEALKDNTSPFRNYYYFEEGENGNPPNNWRSYFGGSAWEKVPNEDNMYYLHAFAKEQPDLNFENDRLRDEIYQMIEWWLKKGIAGFRIDAILNLKKRMTKGIFEADFKDGTVFIGDWILNQPGIEKWLTEMKDIYNKYNAMTVAEANVPTERLSEYIGPEGYFSMTFDFSYTDIDVPATGEWFIESDWTWKDFIDRVHQSQIELKDFAWPAPYFENHDQPRSVNKYFSNNHVNDTTKKLLATILLTLRGTPFIYQGQEIGMTNYLLDDINQYDDVATKDQYQRAIKYGFSEEESLKLVGNRSRDNSRFPIQWSNEQNGGFSDAKKTWLPVNPDYVNINVKDSIVNEASVLNYYRKLIDLRKNSEYRSVLTQGDYDKLTISPNVLSFRRKIGKKEVYIHVNFSEKLVDINKEKYKLLLSNMDIKDMKTKTLALRPLESVILANF